MNEYELKEEVRGITLYIVLGFIRGSPTELLYWAH